MNAGMRGLMVFIGIVVVVGIFCGFIPFVLLPSLDMGMALPVIQLPGEILAKDWPLVGDFTNTAVGMIITDIFVVMIALALRNPKMVPEGFQNFFEVIVEYLYNLTKQVVGVKNTVKIFPLVASIFLVVLVANWIELIPGVDSIGLIHCADEGMAGYPITTEYENEDSINTLNFLKVDKALFGGGDPKSGEPATKADYYACEEKWFGITEHGEDHSEDADHDTANAEHDTADTTEVDHEEGDTTEENDVAVEEEADHSVADVEHADGPVIEEGQEHPDGHPDYLVVTPFVRAAATDLNMTLSLALIAFLAIQFFGTQELGLSYYAKFINLPALGNLGKKPMGAMDFVVGLLEIISELAKILSFGFRLFGNIFAGQVLLFVMAFLVATLLPGVFYGLELFVGLIQAFVFFMLTLVFSGMAMEGHHGDDDHDHH